MGRMAQAFSSWMIAVICSFLMPKPTGTSLAAGGGGKG